MKEVIGIDTRTCKECGKQFVLPGGPDMWAYYTHWRGKKRYFCSWGCLRAHEKEHEAKEAERKHERISQAMLKVWEQRRAANGRTVLQPGVYR